MKILRRKIKFLWHDSICLRSMLFSILYNIYILYPLKLGGKWTEGGLYNYVIKANIENNNY